MMKIYTNNIKFTQQGFTLIELMIVVAVLAIISAIALPAYNGYVQTSREAVLINNISTIEVFQEETEQLRDLEFAQRIQNSQLPECLPETANLNFDVRYYPHDLVGGDFYDVRQVGRDQFGFLLADVSGHGIPAALYTMQLRGIGEECWEVGTDPSAFLTRASSRLAGSRAWSLC